MTAKYAHYISVDKNDNIDGWNEVTKLVEGLIAYVDTHQEIASSVYHRKNCRVCQLLKEIKSMGKSKPKPKPWGSDWIKGPWI